MNETGVVKFHCESGGRELSPFAGLEELQSAREELRRRGLLGVDETGIGFGNVSQRVEESDTFHITGSGTGRLPRLGLQDFAKVTEWDFARNWLRSTGRAIPSAESLTHAAIYAEAAEARMVLHGHDARLWRNLCERGIVTRPDVPYGTPALAREVQRLFRETDVRMKKIFAIAGHRDGIVTFGRDLAEATAGLGAA